MDDNYSSNSMLKRQQHTSVNIQSASLKLPSYTNVCLVDGRFDPYDSGVLPVEAGLERATKVGILIGREVESCD